MMKTRKILVVIADQGMEMKTCRINVVFATLLVAGLAGSVRADTHVWDASEDPDLNWSTPANWTAAGPPAPADITEFDDTSLKGAMFNVTDDARYVRYHNTVGIHTTTVPVGVTMNVTGSGAGGNGYLSVGYLSDGASACITGSGTLQLGGGTYWADIYVGRNQNLAAARSGYLKINGVTIDDSLLQYVYVGQDSYNMVAQEIGTLDLTNAVLQNDMFICRSLRVGDGRYTDGTVIFPSSMTNLTINSSADGEGLRVGYGHPGVGTINFDGNGTGSQLKEIAVTPVGGNYAHFLIASGGRYTALEPEPSATFTGLGSDIILTLGTATRYVYFSLGYKDLNDADALARGYLDLSNATFNAVNVDFLRVGYNTVNNGSAAGTLDLSYATINDGADAVPDMLSLRHLGIGYGQDSKGVLLLPSSLTNLTINPAADSEGFWVGDGNNAQGTIDFDGSGTGSQLKSLSVVPVGGTYGLFNYCRGGRLTGGDPEPTTTLVGLPTDIEFTLGSATRRVQLNVAFNELNDADSTAHGCLDLSNATFNAVYLGYTRIGYHSYNYAASTAGTVDFSHATITSGDPATPNQLIARHLAIGYGRDSEGVLVLPSSLTNLTLRPLADAEGLQVGYGNSARGTIDFDGSGTGSQLASITIEPLGGTYAEFNYGCGGKYDPGDPDPTTSLAGMPTDITLTLGTSAQRVDLYVARNDLADADSVFGANLDLSNCTFNAVNLGYLGIGYNTQTLGGPGGTLDLSSATIYDGVAGTANELTTRYLLQGYGANGNGVLKLPAALEKFVVDGVHFFLSGGYMDFNPLNDPGGSQLNEIRFTGAGGSRDMYIGAYNGTAYFTNLPDNVAYNFGTEAVVDLYIGYRCGGAYFAHGWFAPPGGTINWNLYQLYVADNDTTGSSYGGRGTLDLINCTVNALSIEQDLFVGGDGNVTANGGNCQGYLRLPACTVTVGDDVHISDTIASGNEGYGRLVLEGTTLQVGDFFGVWEAGTVDISVGQTSCGLDLKSSDEADFDIDNDQGGADPARLNITFTTDPADYGSDIWGLRMTNANPGVDNHVAFLEGLTNAGWIVLSADTFGAGNIVVFADDNYTYIGVTGGTITATGPEIDIFGNDSIIVDGSTGYSDPATGNDTDFGEVALDDPTHVHTFTITNSGTTTLTLDATPVTIVNGPQFSIEAQPGDLSLDPGESTTFQIGYNPSAAGVAYALIQVGSDDSSEDPYDFRIKGTEQDSAGIVFVDKDATGNGEGSSWSNAYVTLTEALAAESDAEIWVADGTYTPVDSPVSADNTFNLQNNDVYGGFNATETARSQRDTAANVVILSGDISGQSPLYVKTVVTKTEAGTAVLDGFIVRDGSSSGAADDGGGMNVAAGTITVANCTFTNNVCGINGGALYLAGCDALVTNCAFLANSNTISTAQYGGAVYVNTQMTAFVLTDCTFVNNESDHSGGDIGVAAISIPVIIRNSSFRGSRSVYHGASIFLESTDLNAFQGLTFLDVQTSDTAARYGGAIYSSATTTKTNLFEDCAFEAVTLAGNGGGGAVCLASGANEFYGCTFTNITPAGGNGGAIHCANGTSNPESLMISNCVFDTIIASSSGGGVYVAELTASSDVTVMDTLFTNITITGYGGAMYLLADDTYTFRNVQCRDIEAGSTTHYGGAICANDTASASMTMEDCVFDGVTLNATGGGGAVYYSGGAVTVAGCTFTNIDGGTGAGGALHLANSAAADESVLVTNCVFGAITNGGSGGCLYTAASRDTLGDVTVVDCRFSDIVAVGHGGTMYLLGNDSHAVRNSTFVNIKAGTTSHGGGALYVVDDNNLSPSLMLSNCVFDAITLNASGGGGVVYCNVGKFIAVDCTFTNVDGGTGVGGAVYLVDSAAADESVLVSNCVFGTISGGGGGALYVAASRDAVADVTVTDCEFMDITSSGYGGALNLAGNDSHTVRNSTFVNITAGSTTHAGGVAYVVDDGNVSTALTLEDCLFDTITLDASGGGGVAYYNGGAFVVSGCTFTNINGGGGSGGALHAANSTVANEPLTVSNCVFHTVSAGVSGGAIYIAAARDDGTSPVTIKDSTFTLCTAGDDGGALWFALTAAQALYVNRCSFVDCSVGTAATDEGGAVYLNNASAGSRIENTVFARNIASAAKGGAVCHVGGYMGYLHCTFHTNSATDGGGIYQTAGSSSVTNSIFWRNKSVTASRQEIYVAAAGDMTNDFSNVDKTRASGDIYYGAVILDNSPGFLGEPSLDLRLAPASPMIDAGVTLPDVVVDRILNTRPYQAGISDIGAYEYSGTATNDVRGTNFTTIADGDDSPDTADGTDFGGVPVAGGTKDHVFTVTNTGTGTLYLNGDPLVFVGGANAGDFTVTVDPPSPALAAGSGVTFTVRFDPGATGSRQAYLSITNSDSGRHPYNFDIQGTGVAPEIDVRGTNMASIADGDNSPETADGTDFGAVAAGNSVSRTFVITNSGDMQLILTGAPSVSVSGAGFSVTTQPASTNLGELAGTTFVVRFAPAGVGVVTGVVTIGSSDGNEDPYDFALLGEGTAGGILAPSVNNNALATNLGATAATLRGAITSTGGEAPNVWIYWGDENGGMDRNGWDTTVDLSTQDGEFSTQVATTSGKLYFYRCYASNSAGGAWAAFTAAWMVKPISLGVWYYSSAPVHWMTDSSNNLNSELGRQLTTGLDGGAGPDLGDMLWFQSGDNWQQYWLNSGGTWMDTNSPPAAANLTIDSGEGFWLKRRTTTPATNMVFIGRAHTNSVEITLGANSWTMFGWPYAPVSQAGWGFTGATAGYGWYDSDCITGDYNGTQFAIYYRVGGNWCTRGTKTPATVKLEPGKAYYYYRRGGSMGWTAPAP